MSDQGDFAGVRVARPEDGEAIYQALKLAHDEHGMFKVSEAKTRGMIQRLTTARFDPDTGAQILPAGFVGVIDGPGYLEGLIVLMFAQYWYTDSWHLEELINFVHPDHRRTTHAKRLLEYAKWWQRGLGIPLIVGIITQRRLEPKMRLYQRQLPQIGALFQCGFDDIPDTFNQRRLAPHPPARKAPAVA